MRRTHRLPAPLAAHVGRRVQSAAPLVRGQWLAVCDDACVVVGEEGLTRQMAWTDVEHASWDGDARRLTLNGVDGSRLVVVTASDDVAAVTAAVRRAVTGSIVHAQFLTTRGGEVRALIRRDAAGNLFSQLIARGPIAPDEQPAVDALEREARAAVGLATP